MDNPLLLCDSRRVCLIILQDRLKFGRLLVCQTFLFSYDRIYLDWIGCRDRGSSSLHVTTHRQTTFLCKVLKTCLFLSDTLTRGSDGTRKVSLYYKPVRWGTLLPLLPTLENSCPSTLLLFHLLRLTTWMSKTPDRPPTYEDCVWEPVALWFARSEWE